jgi:DNA-binding response OmpR family regulator
MLNKKIGKEKLHKHIILVVEDERPLQEAIKAKLIKEGFEVVTARAVREAYNFLKDIKNVEAIWLDHYLLGQENGLDFVVAVKENNQWIKIPIFVVSNTASPDKVQTYLRLGVHKYYTKADNRLDQIIKDIKKFLNKGEE